MKQQFSIGPMYAQSLLLLLLGLQLIVLVATAVNPLEMGLSLLTTLLVCSPSATCKARTTCTITLLPSLADQE